MLQLRNSRRNPKVHKGGLILQKIGINTEEAKCPDDTKSFRAIRTREINGNFRGHS